MFSLYGTLLLLVRKALHKYVSLTYLFTYLLVGESARRDGQSRCHMLTRRSECVCVCECGGGWFKTCARITHAPQVNKQPYALIIRKWPWYKQDNPSTSRCAVMEK